MTSSTWAQIDTLARLAPTPHNTQPFRIRPLDERHAELVVLANRLLPREDHGNLYMASAFGILAEAVRLAELHHGLVVRVLPSDGIAPATLHERPRRSPPSPQLISPVLRAPNPGASTLAAAS